MNDPRKYILVGAICLLVGMFGVTIMRDWPRLTGKQKPESMVAQPTSVPTPSLYADWTLFRNGYALLLPPDWKNTSDLGGTAVLEPGRKIGSITKLSVTILSDAKAPQGQRFTTQKEFDEWSAVSGQVQGSIQKVNTTLVDGEKAVALMDVTSGDTKWREIVWVRKEERNVYLTFQGGDIFTSEDESAIAYITSQFMFTPPPSTGKESKE